MLAHAGSFDDFFTYIIRDDAKGLEALVQRGFDPNTMNDNGETGLTQAFKRDAYRAAMALVHMPTVNVNLANARGETPLMMAAIKRRLDLAQALVQRGADVNRPGWTPLHYAVAASSDDDADLKIIALLLDQHAYIDAPSPNGTTPLMMAAQYGSSSAVQALLTAGADASLKNQQGLTARDFADRADRGEVARWLGQGNHAQQPAPVGKRPNLSGPAFPQEGRKKIRSNW